MVLWEPRLLPVVPGRFAALKIAERTDEREDGRWAVPREPGSRTLHGLLSKGWALASIPAALGKAPVPGLEEAGVPVGVTPGVLIGAVVGVLGPSFAQARENTGWAEALEHGLEGEGIERERGGHYVLHMDTCHIRKDNERWQP